MTNAGTDTAAPQALPAHRAHLGTLPRLLFALNAISAWIGVGISATSSALALYTYPLTNPTLLGNNTSVVGRLLDTFSYFTIWSNLVVAIVMTILVFAPNRGRIFQVLRLDSVLMITVTGILYWLLLASINNSQGIDRIGNLFNHSITPVLTVLVWLVAGPRNWIRWWTVPAALILPLVWAVYALVRGTVINAYPYPFLNVAERGLPAVLTTLVMIVVFGIIIGLVCWGLDFLLSGRARRSAAAASAPAEESAALAGSAG